MWKDFFYYSKAERRAIVLLLFLIGMNMIASILIPEFFHTGTDVSDEMMDEIASFRAELDSMTHQKKESASYSNKKHLVAAQPQLADFDPNTADSLTLIRLGFPHYVARNLIKYRRAGGKFRTVDDLAKIYGMTEQQFSQMKPYVHISSDIRNRKESPAESYPDSTRVSPVADKAFKYPEGTQLDLNKVDTSELKKVPGIGSGIARQIIYYRQRLGGFHDVSQLSDLESVADSTLHWFYIGDPSIVRLNVNTAGLEKLRNHPYMNFYKARAIVEHRKKRGKLTDISQLSLYEEFTEEDLRRLSYYLSFD